MRPQIFHSTYYALPYWPELRSVVTVHDFIYEKFSSLLGDAHDFIQQKKYVIERADAIIAVSHSTKEDILEYTAAEEEKITVIYHGVSEAFLDQAPSEEKKKAFREKHRVGNPYWLYVGPRGLYKNFGTFLRAFVKVAPCTDGYLIAVGGEPKLEPWQVDLLIRNRLDQKVRLFSEVDDEALSLAYSASVGLVSPSLAEGFGIPLLEAMACGTPIIASDIPVFREIATDSALYFNPYDEEALAEAMTKVLDETTRENLTRKGQRRVANFSWDTASCILGSVYKSLI
jgi:glycosyltransferase involved in cell wall biosynthesis